MSGDSKLNGRTVAVVIGIETYHRHSGGQEIRGVEFAESDAREVASTLKTRFKIHDDDLHLWINQEATKTILENELTYLASSLEPHDRFIFYYAGHGFYANAANHLTAWDTHPTHFDTTTVCIRDVLLSPLEKAKCSQVLLFIDACAVPLPGIAGSRGVMSNMSKKEFDEFVHSREYQAIFMSCSPGEKSFPSQSLKHGIWTFHLLRALDGREPRALERRESLTDASLRDYLHQGVVKYIREETNIKALQRPLALVNATHTFEILRFEEDRVIAQLPQLKLQPDAMFFRQRESSSFRELPGFDRKRRHTIPERHSDSADNWASRLLSDKIASESKEVYENCKTVLGLKRAGVNRNTGASGATVDTELFRMVWDTGQDPSDHTCALITRTLHLRVSPSELPDDFDEVFPIEPDELVIPIKGDVDFDVVADAFESLESTLNGASFEEDEDAGIASLTLEDGTSLTVATSDNELIVRMAKRGGVLVLLRQSAATLRKLAQKEVAGLLS